MYNGVLCLPLQVGLKIVAFKNDVAAVVMAKQIHEIQTVVKEVICKMKDWLEIARIIVADFKRKNCHKFTLGDRLPKNEQRTILLIKCRNGRRRARRRDMCVNHYNRECSYHLTELVTGHRGYYKYLDRIGYDDSSICPTCPEEEEDAIFFAVI